MASRSTASPRLRPPRHGLSNLRIILVLNEPPLPFGGAAARWYYVLLRGLVARGHRVTTFAPAPQVDAAERARELFEVDRYDLRLDSDTVRPKGWQSKLQTLI